ncbi:MAG: thioredoxin fold domain-containing protein [Lysobacterales bacterium]
MLARIPQSDRIVFRAPNAKHAVVVFTDVECGFCRKFHSQIADYNKAGITVEYMAFPRAGIGSPDYDTMVSVLPMLAGPAEGAHRCQERPPAAPARLPNPVADECALGQRCRRWRARR